MSLFWHKGATRIQKGCGILLVFFFALFIYSFFTNYTPSEISNKYSAYVVSVCALIYFFPSFGLLTKFPTLSLAKKILSGLFWYLFLFMIMYLPITVALPSLFVDHLGSDYEYEGVIIEKKGGYSMRRGCSYEIRVDGYYLFLGGMYLCTSKTMWDAVQVNQKVVLIGKEFSLGRKITKFRYEPSSNSHDLEGKKDAPS